MKNLKLFDCLKYCFYGMIICLNTVIWFQIFLYKKKKQKKTQKKNKFNFTIE